MKDTSAVAFVVPLASCEYLGAGLLASCLRRDGFQNVRIFSLAEEGALFRYLSRYSPGIVAFSSVTPSLKASIALAGRVKRRLPGAIVVAGGPHPTFSPGVIAHPGIDGVCIGEGEEAFVEFVRAVREGGLPAARQLKNWWIKGEGGKVYKNPPRPVVSDLDSLPFAERIRLPFYRFPKRRFRHFIFSRGCPFNCSYCSVPALPGVYGMSFAQYYRVRSPQSAIAEITHVLRETGGSIAAMNDSVFGCRPEWLEEFSSLYKKKIPYPFYCHTEVRMVTEKYARSLKAAGCFFVFLGLETARGQVRKEELNKSFDNEAFRRAVSILRNEKLKVNFYNMVGIPGTSMADDLETYGVNVEMRPGYACCEIFSLYPGTALKKSGEDETGECTYRPAYPPGVRARLERLQCLFSMGVCLRVPVSLMRVLIALPLEPFYWLIAMATTRLPLYCLMRRFLVKRPGRFHKDGEMLEGRERVEAA